jgi:L-iditol 2-dehydrogenase
MKSAQLIGPRTINVVEVPDPVVPMDGLVLQMAACGVCGSDLRRWQEGPPDGTNHLVQGHELAGTILAAGSQVTPFKVGDRLAIAPDIHCGECFYCRRGLYNLCPRLRLLGITPGLDGGFSEKVLIPGEILRHGVIHSLPDQATFLEGALAETLSSVLSAQEKSNLSLGETVVIMGAGPIGCLHLVVAKARGAQVIVAEPNPIRRHGAEKFMPDAIIDVTAQNAVDEVRRITSGVGADVVICANPVAATQTQAVEMARRGGRIILFGGLPKSDPMTHLDGNRIHYGEIMVVGAFSYHPRFHEEALKMLARKRILADLFVTHTRPLSRIAEAFEIARSGEALKVVVTPD